MNAAAKKHRPTFMRRREYFRRLGKGCIGTPAPTVRSMVPTSTRAHDIQPIPPQKNLTIRGSTSPCHSTEVRHQHTPRCAPSRAAPRLKRRQEARSSRQHALRPDVPDTPPRKKRLTTNQRAQTVVHYTPKTPCHPHSTEVDCTLSKHSGGFATIDPRHAGDTPQGSAYGSNSPQTTNEHKPNPTPTNTRRQAEHDPRHHTTSDIGNGLTH